MAAAVSSGGGWLDDERCAHLASSRQSYRMVPVALP